MKSLADMISDIAINNSVFGGDIQVGTTYPDNDWGIIFAHFESSVFVYQFARVETKDKGLRRDHFTSLATDPKSEDWAEWNDQNRNIPTIPHNPVIYEATKSACEYFADPPSSLRKCLSILAAEDGLSDEDWPTFLLMYGEFRGHLAVLHSRDATVDELDRQRKARKNNNDRRMAYAAQFISKELKVRKTMTMEAARNVFGIHIKNILNGSESPPEGWNKEEFAVFLGKSDKDEPLLKKQYGQNLTKNKLKDWI